MPSDQQLSRVLSEFARTMVTDFPIQGILDRLVERIVDLLPISAAGVTLISPGNEPCYVAASDEAAMRFEQLQTDLREGPCVAAYQTGLAVAVPDLRADQRFPRFAPDALAAGLAAVFTFPLRRGDAQVGALDLYRDVPGPLDATTMTAAQTLADVAASYLLNAQARADLQVSSNQSRHSALHDALTGCPNRILLLERLEHALLRGHRSGSTTAVLFADLDHFEAVNDTHGHRVGDELLVAVAERVAAQLRPGDTLARLSGDEFVILCEDLAGVAEAFTIASRIEAALARPFLLSSGAASETTASIGIALAERDDHLAEDLLHRADLAMYQAKRRGGAGHQLLDENEQDLVGQRLGLHSDLRGAWARGELRLEYQPIVRTLNRCIIGVEALVRWAHPTHGAISPTALASLAEQSSAIPEIGRWVLEQACQDRGRWASPGTGDDLTVSVNISAAQLMSPELVRTVEEVLSSTGTDPTLLTLEVTEGVFIQDSRRALIVLKGLKQLGVKLALDDFGTGYSSLSYLKQFPVDIVKIDQEFIIDLDRDRTSHVIVAAVVDLAHALGLVVVAEGIESRAQHDEVSALGCDASQGYFFARAMTANAVDALMSHGEPGTSNPRLPALAAVR